LSTSTRQAGVIVAGGQGFGVGQTCLVVNLQFTDNLDAEAVGPPNDQRDGFGLAHGNVGDLSGVGTFAVGGAVQMAAIARSFVRQSMSR
jgi:hypothetical protein